MRIGVDLGGTKIEAVALGEEGEILARRRQITPRGDYDSTIAVIADLVDGLERQLGRQGSIGIGIPGALSPASGLVKNANSTWLIGRPIDRDLSAALRRPVRVENDANCFALSEAVDGAGAGARVVFGVILGTGVGGGIVVDGHIILGHNAIAGEWGHNPLPWPGEGEQPGPPCYCGRRGCIEAFLSGPGLARDYGAAGGGELCPEQIASRAAKGDPLAEATLLRHEDRLARALATVINVVDPDVIVLGGGLSNLDRLYHGLNEKLPAYVFSDRLDTPVLPPRHGASSGVRGAAWLWPPGGAERVDGGAGP
jgi:fructokinase